MGLTNREYIGRAMDIMSSGLEPYIQATMAIAVPGVEWPRILEHKDDLENRESKLYNATDPQVQLRMLTERLGSLGFPFNLAPEGRAYASEMRQVRNLWAHNEPFNDSDVQRYLDTTARLLHSVGSAQGGERVSAVLAEFRREKDSLQPDSHRENPEKQTSTDAHVERGADTQSPAGEDARDFAPPADAMVEISIEASAELSYVMAYNGRRVINRLTVTNHGPELRGALLTLTVTGESGRVSRPSEHHLDIPANKAVTIAEPDLQADPAKMLQLQGRQRGQLQAELEVDGVIVAQQSDDIQLLAAHHWVHRSGLLSLESLAAFVQPNHPAISKLCLEASDLLRTRTESGSLQGYQDGPKRVDAIAEAIATAMKNREIRYSEPPASWGEQAQRIRNAEEVLEGRFGTCLDTVVVLAAALEFAGIQANLWLVEGHIFLGYWRDEANFKTAAVEEPGLLVNAVDMGRIQLIETTLLTDSSEHSMQELHDRPYSRWLTNDLEKMLGVVDIYGARNSGILPIPARFTDDSGQVAVVEYTPPRWEVPAVPAVPSASQLPEARRRQRPEMPTRIRQWKNTLLDLSLRNRLINFTKTARFPLAVPDTRVGQFEDMVNGGHAITLRPSDDVSAMQTERGIRFGRDLPQDQLADILINDQTVYADVTSDAYQTRMRNLAYKAKTLVEETGANNLYLAIGTLVWNLDGRELRSPLVLVPVQLRPTTKYGAYQISLDDAGTSTPNYCLLEKLRLTLGLEIPGLAEPLEDGSGIDLDAAFKAVRTAVAEKALPYRVEPTVDLSILQFAKFRLWKDLDEHWQTLSANPLVQHLIHTPTDTFVDPVKVDSTADLDQLAASIPIPADSSQLQAIAEAVSGKTFVLEGPPGTGKSQTITNLLIRAIAEGKRVLFVAEKRAALDVVQKRLNEVGMGVFSLDLHDKGSKPTAVREQIRLALEHSVDPDKQGLSAALGELHNARRGLVRYASRLHEENNAELSLYTARTQELAVGDDVRQLYVPESFAAEVTEELLQRLRRMLAELPDVAEPARPDERHPWGFIDKVLDASATDGVADAAHRLQSALEQLPASEELFQVLLAARTPADLDKLTALLRSEKVDMDVLDEANTERWSKAVQTVGTQMTAFLAASHPGLAKVTPEAFDLPVADLHAQAVSAAESGFFGRKKRLIAVRDQLVNVTRANVEIRAKEVPELTGALLSVQGAIRGLASGITAIPGLRLPASWNPFTPAGQEYLHNNIQWLQWAASLVKVEETPQPEDFLTVLRAFLRDRSVSDATTTAVVASIAQAVSDLLSTAGVDGKALTTWLGERRLLARWEETARGRDLDKHGVPSLRRWLAFVEQLELLRSTGLVQAREQLKLGRISSDDAGRAFERGLALASQRERASATGLDGFEPRSHEKMIQRFTGRSEDVRELLRASVPDEVLSARHFDADSKAGDMGRLRRQLNYKSGGLRVRPLLETYGELITQIMPCVLVSPDSVARFFPAKSALFDLVVFDEASQIRVADAVGAMGRGHSVVVVGDSKQMPPTSFAETTMEKDEETELANETVEDEESILSECVIARVPRQWLSWHYRSQDESLIAFSNQQYYDSKLSSFPAPVHGPSSSAIDGYGISFVKVDGQFNRTGAGKLLRTNPVEANAVVQEIQRQFAASPSMYPSVGVVTFNLQQRAYIESLLRDCDDPRIGDALDATDGLFVKNLENVQGDERDTILFSTGFSKNDRGYLPLNFGPLNRSGGERRLNVAVTRARRQVIVFSSFDPSELRAEETSSMGIKHLRSYLELAAHGPDALPFDARRKPAIDRHREQIAEALREQGLVVMTDVGLSDFKVDLSVALTEAPQRPIMAVLLDSPAWAARGTVGDRDGLPTDVLSRMLRWPAVERVWLPEWLADSDSVVQRLVAAALKAASTDSSATDILEEEEMPQNEDFQDSDKGTETSDDDTESFEDDVSEEDLVLTRSGANDQEPPVQYQPTLYRPWYFRGAGDLEVLDSLRYSATAQTRVQEVIGQVVDVEGPIHSNRLAKLVCSEFGLNKMSSQRAEAVLSLLDRDKFRTDQESFVWSVDVDQESWHGYRQNGQDIYRKIEHIGRREIFNAMVHFCNDFEGIPAEELKRQVNRIFGGQRLTSGIRNRLTEVLDEGLASRRLHMDDTGYIHVAELQKCNVL